MIETTVFKIFHVRKELLQRIDCLQCKAKKLFKQRFDFLFEKRIETADRLPAVEGHTIVESTVRFSI